MSFFDNLFGRKEVIKHQPEIVFGRYSDSYKTEKEYDAWDKALSFFEEENYRKQFTDALKECVGMGNFKYPMNTFL